jgi:aspartate racemase
MGPEATVLLMQKLIGATPARDDADHIPLIVHQNPQVPSRIRALIEGTGADPGPVLVAMARDLERAGATALAMPCNTAHAYADVVRAATGLPFIDMIHHTAAHLAALHPYGGRIAMLASPAVRLAGVFDASFAEFELIPVWPEDEIPVLGLIRAVKAGRAGEDEADAFAALAAANLVDAGAARALVACTELSLLTAGLPAGLDWTDSLDILVQEIRAFATAG